MKSLAGEKITLHFDPQRIETVPRGFDCKKRTGYQYAVTDANESEETEKFFTVSYNFGDNRYEPG